jgi:putative serine protease PepD
LGGLGAFGDPPSDDPDDDTVVLGPGDSGLGESSDDDSDGPSGTRSMPLPPEDRLWRHPSELKFTSERPRRALDPWLDGIWPTATATDRPTRTVIYSAAVLSGVLAAALTAGLFLWMGPARERVVERTVERHVAPDGDVDAVVARFGNQSLDVARVAEDVRPSIVQLDVSGTTPGTTGSGSGVIFRSDGHILTNAHVVEGTEQIEVVLADGQRLEAEVVGTDTLTDIAVLAVISELDDPLPVATLGRTTTLKVGQPAIAIGSPLGLSGGPTVTVGVISAIGRVVDTPAGSRLYDLVQTDAPIMPGSSGGALLDANGKVIGITTVIGVSDVGAEGVGFAVPIEIAHDVARDLLTTGEARHGFLGVAGADVTAEQAEDLGIDGGAVLTEVVDGHPAADAGLRNGDLVTRLEGEVITSMAELIVGVRRLEPGTRVALTVVRDGDEMELEVIVAQRPA